MNILLFGKEGQVGQELMRSLLPLGKLTALGLADLDLQNQQALQQTLQRIQPDVIINAAAYTAVDKAETDKALAWAVNATAVEVMAAYAKKHQVLLVHYSTDYVFDGKKTSAYQESDTPNPLNIYGASKLAGEKAILGSGCPNLIFRTSWVFSAHGANFIKTILKLARDKTALNVIDDQRGAPTSAELLADITAHALIAHRRQKLPSGLYHLTANGVVSWHGLACYIIEYAQKQAIRFQLTPAQIQPVLTEAYPSPTKRPKNSVLDTQALSSQLNIVLPDWTHYVNRMIDQLIQIRFFA